MKYTEILYETRDRIATITLNRPSKLNAWTPVMDGEMRAAMLAADEDAQVRAIVVTGSGRGFCAGADMNLLGGVAADGAHPPSAPPADEYGSFGYLLRLRKPVIAAINGPAVGIGLCLTLFCDIRMMAAETKLGTAFARRGLIAEHGISWFLPRLIGPMNALDLLYSARLVPAAEAAQLGLVQLLPQEGFAEAAHARALELVQLSSPRSMAVIKRQVYDALTQTLPEALRIADDEMAKSFGSEDFREGVAHFIEKRPPVFTGR